MPEYLSPGVYVEERDLGPKPIEGVGTAMAAFVGFTEKAVATRRVDGEVIEENVINRPQLITNWSQYQETFGDFVEGAYLPHAVYGYFNNGGNRCYVISVKTLGRAEAPLLGADGKRHLIARAKRAGHDGLRLRVKVDFPEEESPPPASQATKVKEGEAEEEKEDKSRAGATNGKERPFTLIVERLGLSGDWRGAETLKGVKLAEIQTEERTRQVEVVYQEGRRPKWIELVVPETPPPLAKMWPTVQQKQLEFKAEQVEAPKAKDFFGEVAERTGIEGLQALDTVTMLCIPDLMSAAPGELPDADMIKAVQRNMIDHCENMADRVAILDPPPHLKPQEITKWRMDIAGYDSSYAALYYPWIEVQDPVLNRPILIPPCGHIAGIWANTDNTRGVHKAPANEVVRGAVGLAYNTSKGEQDELNPNGVNCIRAFPGRGIRVWGARTLSSDPAWRYINVRRLFNFVEKSIERGTQWVVFEPNDMLLWARVRRDVSAFLTTVWSDGALFGASPAEAFFVKCDAETNPPESRDLGRLIILIGICPVKPAEFVIFRISQWAGPGASEA